MDEITIWLPAELKEAVQQHAAERGESVQDFLIRAIQETMLNDTKAQTHTGWRRVHPIHQRLVVNMFVSHFKKRTVKDSRGCDKMIVARKGLTPITYKHSITVYP